MNNGTIKKLVSDRGFGFIAAEDGKEYFFHRDAVDNFDWLNGGEKVTFEVEPSPKGPRAKQVRLSQYSSNGSSAARIGAACSQWPPLVLKAPGRGVLYASSGTSA